MVCALSEKQLELLLEKVFGDLYSLIDSGKKLNLKDYISSIYNAVNDKTKDQARAQTYAALLPSKILLARSVNSEIRKLIPVTQVTELAQLEEYFEDFDYVGEYLGIGKPSELPEVINTPEEVERSNEKELNKSAQISGTNFFSARPDTFFATSGYEPVMAFSYGFIEKMILDDTLTTETNDFHLTMMRGSKFLRDTDGYSKDYIDGVVNTISDSEGNPLYFDENYNLTTRENGKPVVFSLRLDNSQVQTPEEVVKYNSNLTSVEDARKYLDNQKNRTKALLNFIFNNPNIRAVHTITNTSKGFIEIDYTSPVMLRNVKFYIDDPIIQVLSKKTEEYTKQIYQLGSANESQTRIEINSLPITDVESGAFLEDSISILMGDENTILSSKGQPSTKEELKYYKEEFYKVFLGNNLSVRINNNGQATDINGKVLSESELRQMLTEFKGKKGIRKQTLNIIQKYAEGTIFYEKLASDEGNKFSMKPVGTKGSLSASQYVKFITNNSFTYYQPNENGVIKPMHPYFNYELPLEERVRLKEEQDRITKGPRKKATRKGVSELFKSNSKLVSIGTQEQYSRWIDYLITKGKLAGTQATEILYHGSDKEFDTFDKSKRGTATGKGYFKDDEQTPIDSLNAFFFSTDSNVSEQYGLIRRVQQIQNIATLLGYALVNTSRYKKLKNYSPELAEHLKEKQKELNKEDFIKYVKEITSRYRKVNDELGTGFFNRVNSYTILGKQLEDLENKKQDILSGKYVHESFSKQYPNLSIYLYEDRFGGTLIRDNGDIQGGIFNGKNITELTNAEFDKLINIGKESYKKGIDDINSIIKKAKITPILYRVLLNIQRPLTKDFEGKPFVDQAYEEGAKYEASKLTNQAAKSKGKYDSVIFKNILDPYLSDNYGVFEPEQVYILGGKEDIEGFSEFVLKDRGVSEVVEETKAEFVNNPEEFVDHSGGARGADEQFDIEGRKKGMTKFRHYYTGEISEKNAPLGNEDITNKPIAVEGAKRVANAAKVMWGYEKTTMKDQRLIRNWAQVDNSEAVFAVAPIGKQGDVWSEDIYKPASEQRKIKKSEAVQGGTGYAVEMAIQEGKPVYVYNDPNAKAKSHLPKGWYTWDGTKYVAISTPVLTKNFAGIGSRNISDDAKKAIADLFENTFPSKPAVPTVVEEVVEETVKPTIDLSRKWTGDLDKTPVYTSAGVNTMRTKAAKENEHFGNPFSESGYSGTIKVNSIADAAVAYKDWLLGKYVLDTKENKVAKLQEGKYKSFAEGYTNIEYINGDILEVPNKEIVPFKEEQRNWIIDQINEGKLDNAVLLYAGKLAARGQGMHPTALAEVVEIIRTGKAVVTTAKPIVKKEFKRKDVTSAADIRKKLNKLVGQKVLNETVSQEKLDAVLNWYNSYKINEGTENEMLLKDLVPFVALFDRINSDNPKAVAEFTASGITLFKGSDYTDLYHEAFHVFTQLFLTADEVQDIYNDVRKLSGSFVDYKGNTVKFSEAEDLQVEEYLAEEFRKYMLSDGKTGAGRVPKAKSFFAKLLEFLKAFFNVGLEDSLTNYEASNNINQLFHNLRVGNISTLKPGYENRQFDKLDKIVGFNLDNQNAIDEISYELQSELVESIDSIFSEFSDELDEIEKSENSAARSTSKIIANPKNRAIVYTEVLKKFIERYNVISDELLSMSYTDPGYNDKLSRQRALEIAIENFSHTTALTGTDSDITSDDIISAQNDGKGLIAYHMQKSRYLSFDDRYEVLDPEDLSKVAGGDYNKKSGNELSAKDLASKEVLYLVRSLFDYENGVPKKNGFGFNKLQDFDLSWRKLAKILEGSKDATEIEERLESIANNTESKDRFFAAQVLSKLGSLKDYSTASDISIAQVNLWTKFVQVYTLDRVPLIQATLKLNNNGDLTDITVGKAQKETDQISRKWESKFTTPPVGHGYIKRIKPGTATKEDKRKGGAYLDLNAVLRDFQTSHVKDPIRFLNQIGILVSDVNEIKSHLQRSSGPVAQFSSFIYNRLKYFRDNDIPVFSVKDIVDKRINGSNETGRYENLLRLEAKYSDVYGVSMVSNAKGDAQYEMMLKSTMSKMISYINEVEDYHVLIGKNSSGEYNYPEMSHLDYKRNPFIKSLDILKTIFGEDFWKEGKGKKKELPAGLMTGFKYASIELLNSSGITLTKEDEHLLGTSAIESDETTNVLHNLYLFAKYGVSHSTQHSDKSSTYLYRLVSPSKRGYINIDMFRSGVSIGKDMFIDKLKGYLSSEVERIYKLRNNDVSGTATVGDTTYKEVGSKFVQFEDILSTNTKKEILDKYVSDNFDETIANNTKLRESIEEDIANYFDKQVIKFKADIAKTKADKSGPIMRALMGEEVTEKLKDQYFSAYVANDFIHKYETTTLFYGDIALYNMIKEEFHKRNSGIAATGTFPRTDNAMINLLNTLFRDKYKESEMFKKSGMELTDYAKHRKRGKTMNSAILEDTKLKSLFVDTYRDIAVKQEKERYEKLKKEFTEEDEKRVRSEFDEYDGMKIGDAQGWITFDAYRALLLKLGKWSSYQEDLYNSIISGKKVDAADIKQFFPIKKMQYWGYLKQDVGLPLLGFHKFSLMPLIPTLIKDSHLETLHNRMVSQGIDYATFQSGSKINSITKDGKVDKFYNDPSDTSKGVAFSDNSYEFTRNEIFVEYFKDQLETSDEYKESIPFSTQLRKLIEEGLYNNGKPVSYKGTRRQWLDEPKKVKEKYEEYVKVENYEKYVRQLTDYKIKELKKETDITFDPKTGKFKLTQKFVDLIKKELSRKDLPEHQIDFIKYDAKGQLIFDLSIHPNAEEVEKLITSLIYKRIVRQKVLGEPLVQVSGAGFEPSGLRKATAEERAKYGQDGLSFYQYDEKGTIAMQAKISLQGEFKKLLKLEDVKYKVRAARELGRNITELQALNELLKDRDWVAKNKKLITISGVRIPVQGRNSMEVIQVAEFLPEYSGNMIILPREIVAKSGSDFDIDKLFLMFPSLIKTSKGVSIITHDPKLEIDVDASKKRIKELYAKLDLANDAANKYAKEYLLSVNQEQKIEVSNTLRTYKKEIERIKDEIWNENEMGNDYPESLFEELYNYQEKIAEIWAEQAKPIKDYYKNTVNVIIDEIDSLKTQIASASSKGIENDLLFSVIDILSMPQNFIDLVTPNGTYILKPIAEDLAEDVRDYNPYDTVSNDGESYTYKKKDKDVKRISGTRIFELGYNRYKQQSNNIGKKTLGMGAVDNTYNTIFNRVGAYMSYEVELGFGKNAYTIYQQIRGMAHNTIIDDFGNSVISLSDLYDANNEYKISTVISQMINGWVDVAKDSWIFDIQGNPEIASTLLFMIQAGIPVKQAIYFVSQPVIRDYVNRQRNIRSVHAKPMNVPSAGTVMYRVQARRELINMLFNSSEKRDMRLNAKAMSNSNLKRTIYKTIIPKYLDEKEIDFSEDTLRKNIKNKEGFTEVDRQVFLHFLEIEEMAKATTKIKLGVNFDTDKLSTLYDVRDKISNFNTLEFENRLPRELVSDIVNNSPIGSFKYDSDIINMIGSLFPTRDSEELISLISNYFGDLTSDDIAEMYSGAFMNKEKLISTFINDFTSYIFQQYIHRPESFDPRKPYKGLEISKGVKVVSVKKLTRGAFVDKGKLYVDFDVLTKDYTKKNFSSEKDVYKERGLAPVPETYFQNGNAETSRNLYVKYVYEREFLRSIYPFEQYKETKDYKLRVENIQKPESQITPEDKIFVYEEFLRDHALLNSLNINFMFKSNNGFANQISAISSKYPDLYKKYSLLESLFPVTRAGVTNLRLTELKLDSDNASIYNEQIESLANPNVKKVDNELDNQIISKLFTMFPFFSLIQSGQDSRGVYSFVKIVDPNKLAKIQSEALAWYNNTAKNDYTFIGDYVLKFNNMYRNNVNDDQTSDTGSDIQDIGTSLVKPRIKNYYNYYAPSEITDKFIVNSPYNPSVKFFLMSSDLKKLQENIERTETGKFVIESSIERYSEINRAEDLKTKQFNTTILRDLVNQKKLNKDRVSVIVTKNISYIIRPEYLITEETPEMYEANVKRIDKYIDSLIEDRDQGVQLYFSPRGYGNSYLGYGRDESLNDYNLVVPEDTKMVPMEKIIDDADLAAWDKLFKAKKERPKEFFTHNSYFTEFYSKELSKRQKAPQSSIWLLQENGLYNLIDRETGEVYIENVSFKTGQKVKVPTPRKAPAPKTFVYLSKRLYEEFGYINPGYNIAARLIEEGAVFEKQLVSTEPMTDEKVREKLKECFKSLLQV